MIRSLHPWNPINGIAGVIILSIDTRALFSSNDDKSDAAQKSQRGFPSRTTVYNFYFQYTYPLPPRVDGARIDRETKKRAKMVVGSWKGNDLKLDIE